MTLSDYSIVMAGFGGQGVLSAGRIIATAALFADYEVSWFPSYGPEMRGGTANCGVVISQDAIGSPVINDIDVLIALNNPSMEKFASQVKTGGVIIVDSTLVKSKPQREDVTFIAIPASDLASEDGNMNFAVVYLLGCMAAVSNSITAENFEAALKDVLPQRHHHLIPQEMEIFAKGAAYA